MFLPFSLKYIVSPFSCNVGFNTWCDLRTIEARRIFIVLHKLKEICFYDKYVKRFKLLQLDLHKNVKF